MLGRIEVSQKRMVGGDRCEGGTSECWTLKGDHVRYQLIKKVVLMVDIS